MRIVWPLSQQTSCGQVRCTFDMAQSQFVSDSLALLSLEREAEVTENEALLSERLQNARELEENGACLQRLQVFSL